MRRATREAEAFARLLDGHGGAPGHAPGPLPADPAVAQLAGLADRLRGLPLRPVAAAEATRARIVAAAAAQPRLGTTGGPAAAGRHLASGARGLGRPVRLAGWHGLAGSVGAKVAIGTLAAAVAFGGLAVATARSGPGDPLYGLKQAIEGTQARPPARPAQVAAGRSDLTSASGHLAKLTALAHHGGSVVAMRAELAGLRRSVLTAGDRLLSAGPAGERVLLSALAREGRELAALLPVVPASVRGEVRAVLTLVRRVERTASGRLHLPTPGHHRQGRQGTGGLLGHHRHHHGLPLPSPPARHHRHRHHRLPLPTPSSPLPTPSSPLPTPSSPLPTPTTPLPSISVSISLSLGL